MFCRLKNVVSLLRVIATLLSLRPFGKINYLFYKDGLSVFQKLLPGLNKFREENRTRIENDIIFNSSFLTLAHAASVWLLS